MFYTYSLPSRAALSLSLDHNLTHKNTENSRPLASSHFIQGARSEREKRPLAMMPGCPAMSNLTSRSSALLRSTRVLGVAMKGTFPTHTADFASRGRGPPSFLAS